jgi:hypothetical protein
LKSEYFDGLRPEADTQGVQDFVTFQAFEIVDPRERRCRKGENFCQPS